MGARNIGIKIAFVVFFILAFLHATALSVIAETAYSLEISGDGVTKPLTLTLTELESMEQYQHVYSTINTWPTKKWYVARGVKLRDLLDLAGIKEEAQLIKFISKDGYEVTLTVKELLKDKRYFFPHLKDNHPNDGRIPGSAEDAVEVEPILALLSAEGSDNPDDMNDRDALLLIFGQRAVTEQTNHLFLKHVSKIEVLSAAPEKWDPPKASIPSGTVVPEGTMITLESKFDNEAKIYYTLDGSTPTVNSPMFNWSSSRWWSLRNNLESVNIPIELKEDVVIKAIVIGPGREDSEVVTFTYKVDRTGKTEDPTKVPGGPPTSITLDRSEIALPVGSSFQLEANVAPFNAVDQRIIWSSSNTSVATVDTEGLVTVVGEGTAIITAKTAIGGLEATCIVRGIGEKKRDNAIGELPVYPSSAERNSEEEMGISVGSEPADELISAEEVDEEIIVSNGEGKIPGRDGHWQHLENKREIGVQPSNANVLLVTGNDSSQIRVYEITLGSANPIQWSARQKNLSFQIEVIILLLFITGVGKKYVEFLKEL